MGRSRLMTTIRGLLRAAPGAFLHDPVFRYSAIGALVSLVVLLARLGGSDPPAGADAGPPPAPAALGSSYGATSVASPPLPAAASSAEPPRIAPSRSLDGIRVAPGNPGDRFGTVPAQRSSP